MRISDWSSDVCSSDLADVNMRDFGKSVIRTGEEALAPESAERLREMKREIDAALRNLVRAGIEDKSIAAGDVTMIAFTLAGALNWPGRWYNPAKGRSISDVAEAKIGRHTSELQSLMRISYAVFCLKKKKK